MEEINAFGPHLMLDLHKCNKDRLTDMEMLTRLLNELPAKIGMTRISEPKMMHYKDKWAETPGITGFVILAESHISLHTFPDDEFVFLDIFSCRNFDFEKTKEQLIEFFGCENPKTHLVKRGEDFHKTLLTPEITKAF
ncbi:MAG: adenosylmethionine decarboxylase [Candidatus Woesearchaeota archaeon]